MTPYPTAITVGEASIPLIAQDDRLRGLGAIMIAGTRVRNTQSRFLPWFDTFDGDIFREFRIRSIDREGDRTRLRTVAVSDPDVLFRERRDSSGDICFRPASWDAPAVELPFDFVFEPAALAIGGHSFTGFRYWFEIECASLPVHRLVDRQTWEVGGNLDDVTICLRNWLTRPRMRIARDTGYSTVGLGDWANLLPGNMWGRWTLLPGFDMQYGSEGILVGQFDRVSLIRTVIESNENEDSLRCLDMHLFEAAPSIRTNPKVILHAGDILDDTDALNLWTRLQNRDHAMACAQFGIADEPPAKVGASLNQWHDVRFDTTYEAAIDVASEFGLEFLFIDPVWEHVESLRDFVHSNISADVRKGSPVEKASLSNMCCTLDFEVNNVWGGEAGLKALCDRARAKDISIISWMATHYSPVSALREDPDLAYGSFGIFAAKESGRHPDTGSAADCWTANLNNQTLYDKIRDQVIGVSQRTGLGGFLWDSYCNLGWWQLDYSGGTFRPQFDKMAELYRELVDAGLYVMPEAIVTFSNHSCCGLHGGNVYDADMIGYSYNTAIGLSYPVEGTGEMDRTKAILTGQESWTLAFECFSHRRIPTFQFHELPREKWDPETAARLKQLFAGYRKTRHLMKERTVLKDGLGVLWQSGTTRDVLYSYKPQALPSGYRGAFDAASGESVGGSIIGYRIYLLDS